MVCIRSIIMSTFTPTDLAIAKHVRSVELSECELYGEDGFWVADLDIVRRQLARWAKELPSVRPFYAVKCNPTPRLLELLASPPYNTGFDCATHAELAHILSLGVPGDDIIYANPCKAPSHLRFAASRSVRTMTFDNVAELHKIARCSPGARCVVRIKLTPTTSGDDDEDIETPRYDLSLKYGVTVDGARELLRLARTLDVAVVGVAFHVGSAQSDVRAYARYICEARRVWRVAEDTGHDFTLLDIGGGFMDERFEEAAAVIRTALEAEFGDVANAQVIAEPGRFICAPAFALATSVVAVRCESEDAAGRRSVYLSDGIYSNLNAATWPGELTFPKAVKGRRMLSVEDADIAPVSPTGSDRDSGIEVGDAYGDADGEVGVQMEGALQEYAVWGPTCDSGDVILKSAWLPRGIEVGDWLVFKELGAYSVCMRSPFNGFATEHKFYYLNE
ncbi:hypothetical protein Dda_2167 [Drechslerella dactyloides]|uniref:Orn/DAP/Arg decarboxylase 2 N-terminal domain-containing protein n=1 Tax=Drechslerella dactyloides TaxID=74499 RepID=A0AAD6J4T9_DREDA|nr:hypothetical protein Dda_2167 [Drechslerella dactyloides]